MPRKITLGSPGHGQSSAVVELGDPPIRFRFKGWNRAIEDELDVIGKQIAELDDTQSGERIELIASQLDVLLEPADDADPEASAGRLVTDAYNAEGSELTQIDVQRLVERVGKEARPT